MHTDQPLYIVERSSFDGTRPFIVLANYRSFNRGCGRYATEQQAKRRARDLTILATLGDEVQS